MDKNLINVNCNICGKLVGKKEKGANTTGIYFWCPRCKKNFQIINISAPVAHDN